MRDQRPRRARRAALTIALGTVALMVSAGVATAAPLVLTRSLVPGWHASHTSVRVVARVLGVPRRTAGQAFAAVHGRKRITSGALQLRSAGAAGGALRRWARARHARRLGLGQGGFAVVKRGTAYVAWREDARLGLLELRAPHPLAAAIDYARLADQALRVPAPSTAWGRVLDRIRPDGTVSKQTALRAFALSYGPLPGIKRPAGRPGPTNPSGTLAATWLLRYRGRLTPAQRRAADRKLGLGRAGRRARASSLTPDPELQTIAEGYAQRYQALLGLPLTLKIELSDSSEPSASTPNALADATPLNRFGQWGGLLSPTRCRIRVFPSSKATDAAHQANDVAHEVFHCFEFEINGWGYTKLSDWITEGMADWAALTVAPIPVGGQGDWLGWYLTTPQTPLFARTYDAAWFWGHLVDKTGSLWPRVHAILRAGRRSNQAAFDAAGGNNAAVLSSWASSVARSAPLGDEWTMSNPVAPPSSFELPESRTDLDEHGFVGAAPYTTSLYTLHLSDAKPIVSIYIGGDARLSWPGQPQITDLKQRWFCVAADPSACSQCPEGQEGQVPATDPLHDADWLAITGDPAGGTVGEIRSYSLDDFCHASTPPQPPSGSPGCGATGCGSSNGDPHLLTFDGVPYDFMAAGEYTAVKSTVDKLEVQVRQQPALGTHEWSVDTAVAARVAGAVVEIDAGTKGLKLRIGKRVARLRRRRALTGGGSVAPLAHGRLAITWPDSTQLIAWPVGQWGVAFLIHPAAARAGHLTGLLGNDGGDPAAPLLGRDGRRYPAQLIAGDDAAAFSARYRKFGPSWLITQRHSLFHYPKGKRTSSYRVHNFPRSNASLSSLTPSQRAYGEQVCRRAGVTDPIALNDCIYDVGVTHRRAFAASSATLQAVSGTGRRTSPVPWTQLSTGASDGSGATPALALDGSAAVAAYTPAGETSIETATFTPSAAGVGGVTHASAFAGWQSVGDPVLLPRPGGGLQLLADGIHSDDSGDPFTGTVSEPRAGDGSFGPPTPLSDVYTGLGTGAVLASDGVTPLYPTSKNGGLVVYRGGSAVDLGSSIPPGTVYIPTMASDRQGRLWLFWYELATDTGQSGIYALQLDPATGTVAANAQPLLAPHSDDDQNNGSRLAVACAQTCRVVYLEGGQLLSWAPGEPAPTGVATATSDDPVGAPFAAFAADGRLWVGWRRDNATGLVVKLAADGVGRGGREVLLAAPGGSTSAYGTAAVATPGGLVVVTNWASGNASSELATIVPSP